MLCRLLQPAERQPECGPSWSPWAWGILIAVLASRRVARPVVTARQVRASDPEQPIQFTQSNVRGSTTWPLAIETLSRDIGRVGPPA